MKNDIDNNTIKYAKIKSVAQAKRICKEKKWELPRMGYEKCIRRSKKGEEYKFETWLVNESGSFRLYTDVNYTFGQMIDNCKHQRYIHSWPSGPSFINPHYRGKI